MGADGVLVAEPLGSYAAVKLSPFCTFWQEWDCGLEREDPWGQGLAWLCESSGSEVLCPITGCASLLLPDLFGVQPCMKLIAGLGFLPEVPAALNGRHKSHRWCLVQRSQAGMPGPWPGAPPLRAVSTWQVRVKWGEQVVQGPRKTPQRSEPSTLSCPRFSINCWQSR